VIRLSTATLSFRRWLPDGTGDMYAEAIEQLPKLGQRYVDLNLWDAGLFTDAAWLRGLKRRLDDAGLAVSSLQGAGRFGDPDPAEADRQVELRKWGIEAAHVFGCDVIAASGPRREGSRIEDVIAFLEEFAPVAEASGVRHALEPHWQNRIEDVEDYRAIFAAVPSPVYGIALDTGHLYAAGASIDAVLDAFVGRVQVLHLKDADRPASHDFAPFGRGEIDNRAIIRRCAAAGFDGFAVLELEVPDMANCLAYLAEGYEHFGPEVGTDLP
jgi:sugar phosphate isomerase/epimerase